MIAVDTSAVITVMLGGADGGSVIAALERSDERVMSHLSVLEATMVLSRLSLQPQTIVDGYLLEARIQVRDFDAAQAQWARYAFLTYGRGRHPARLNFGDCISYALARSLDVPLLYVGNDFTKTDIAAA